MKDEGARAELAFVIPSDGTAVTPQLKNMKLRSTTGKGFTSVVILSVSEGSERPDKPARSRE